MIEVCICMVFKLGIVNTNEEHIKFFQYIIRRMDRNIRKDESVWQK